MKNANCPFMHRHTKRFKLNYSKKDFKIRWKMAKIRTNAKRACYFMLGKIPFVIGFIHIFKNYLETAKEIRMN